MNKKTESNELKLSPEEWGLQEGVKIEIVKGAFLNYPSKLVSKSEFEKEIERFLNSKASY
jgi:hypothetical protein